MSDDRDRVQVNPIDGEAEEDDDQSVSDENMSEAERIEAEMVNWMSG